MSCERKIQSEYHVREKSQHNIVTVIHGGQMNCSFTAAILIK